MPYPLAKHRRMAAIYAQMAEELRRAGIIFSVNLASLIGHSDAPVADERVSVVSEICRRRFAPGARLLLLSGRAMAGVCGQVCALYAAGKPDKMFINDDFRSLNHSTAFAVTFAPCMSGKPPRP